MTSWPGRARLLPLLVWLPCTALRGQTLPPQQPGVPEPVAPEAPGDVPAATPTSTWRLFLGLYGGYDTNVEFEAPVDSGDSGLGARVSIAHTSRGAHSLFSLSLQGGGVHYSDISTADHFDGSGGLDTRFELSSRTALSLNASGSYTNTDLSRILITSGIQLPRSQTLDYGGGMGLDFRLGERTTLGLQARYDRVDFEEPELIDSESGNASLALSQRLSARSTLSLSYRFLRTNDITEGFDSHEAGLGWSYRLARHLTLSLAAGPGYAVEPLPDGAHEGRFYYFGTAGLTGQIRRSTLGLQLRRSTNPAYGLGGNRLSYGAALSLAIPIGRRAELDMGGVHTWSEDPLGENATLQYVSDDANATFSVTFLRRLGLSLGYVFRRNEPEGGLPVTDHRGTFGLTYTHDWP